MGRDLNNRGDSNPELGRDVPVPGDYDGDGADLAVYRRARAIGHPSRDGA